MRRQKRPPNPLLPHSGAPGGAARSGSAARRLFSLSILRRRALYETRQRIVYLKLNLNLRAHLQDFSEGLAC